MHFPHFLSENVILSFLRLVRARIAAHALLIFFNGGTKMKKLAKTVFSLALALCLVLSLGGAAFAETYYIEDGSITVNASESGQTVSQGETYQNTPDAAPIISNRNPGTASSNTVTINAEAGSTANVTFDDLNISSGGGAPVSVTGAGDVKIELDGNNKLKVWNVNSGHAALEKNDATSTGTLTITDKDGDGKLTSQNTGGYGAGIGGSMANSTSNITIEGGEIDAAGAKSAAAIGGGSAPNANSTGGSAENIRITGGKVTAGSNGTAIGAGFGGEYARDIVISGDADVTATGGSGAGIGGASNVKEVSITISGNATVKATADNAAAIGAGTNGNVNSIVISDNAQVTAEIVDGIYMNNEYGAPIGTGGHNGQHGKDISPDTSKLTPNGYVKTIDIDKNEKTIVGSYIPAASVTASAAAPVYARYYVIDGKNAEWLRDSGEDLTFLLNSDKVEKVVIDGTEVEFEINPDGEVVIYAELLQTLDNGQHEIEFIFADGSCKTTFTMK